MRHKIGIVGSGHVGNEVANEIVRMNMGDRVLVDVRADVARAKALDLSHTAPIRQSSASVADGVYVGVPAVVGSRGFKRSLSCGWMSRNWARCAHRRATCIDCSRE